MKLNTFRNDAIVTGINVLDGGPATGDLVLNFYLFMLLQNSTFSFHQCVIK